MNIKEKEITEKIINHFKDTYSVRRFPFSLSSNENTLEFNLKYDFKLFLSVYVIRKLFCSDSSSETIKLKFVLNRDNHIVEFDYSDDDKYLSIIESILDGLKYQIELYDNFIKDFSLYVDDLDHEYMINLNSGFMYIKNSNNKAVIYPVLEFDHDEDYATMYVNSLEGKYPMKMYSSISLDNAWDFVSFFL